MVYLLLIIIINKLYCIVPVQQKEEAEILQETETVHTCTYISKG